MAICYYCKCSIAEGCEVSREIAVPTTKSFSFGTGVYGTFGAVSNKSFETLCPSCSSKLDSKTPRFVRWLKKIWHVITLPYYIVMMLKFYWIDKGW